MGHLPETRVIVYAVGSLFTGTIVKACLSYIRTRHGHSRYRFAEYAAAIIAGLFVVYELVRRDPYAGYLYWLYLLMLAYAPWVITFTAIPLKNTRR